MLLDDKKKGKKVKFVERVRETSQQNFPNEIEDLKIRKNERLQIFKTFQGSLESFAWQFYVLLHDRSIFGIVSFYL